MYRLDFVITRIVTSDGVKCDLSIDKFVIIPGKVIYDTRDDAECARIDLSRNATNGYYRVVEF